MSVKEAERVAREIAEKSEVLGIMEAKRIKHASRKRSAMDNVKSC